MNIICYGKCTHECAAMKDDGTCILRDEKKTAPKETAKSSLIVIKPCPFCGGNARLRKGFPSTQGKGQGQRLIQCEKCGCRTRIFHQKPMEAWQDNERACIEAWNRRVNKND